jgi:ribonuclease HII
MNERMAFDREAIGDHAYLLGIDEAGRGPLAGPVVVCGVKMSQKFLHHLADFPLLEADKDSKKLSPKKREILFQHLLELRQKYMLQWALALRNPKIIDAINILEATTEAMGDVICKLYMQNIKILIDGNPVRHLPFEHRGVIRGDGKSFCLGMASIIAKITRDRIMDAFGKKYPQYGFEKHKGYGTAAHISAIKKYGPSPIHRKTFCKNFQN